MENLFSSFLKKQREYLDYFFDQVDTTKAEKILSFLQTCTGSILFSGIGKSGFIAKKLAATFASTGTRAYYLCPIDAVHGDLGMLQEKDLVFFLSKSGRTEELLRLIPYIHQKKGRIISLVCEKNTPLEKQSDYTVVLPLKQEICPYGLVPTTSTALQLIFGDILAVLLMEKNKFSLKEYAKNHPSGMIGRRVTKQVKDLMQEAPIAYLEDVLVDKLSDFSEKKCGCLVVVDEKKQLCGIFTDGDLRRALQKEGVNLLQKKLKDIMSPAPSYIGPDHLAFLGLQQMENPSKPIMVLPVVENLKVIGILRMHDILQEGLR